MFTKHAGDEAGVVEVPALVATSHPRPTIRETIVRRIRS